MADKTFSEFVTKERRRLTKQRNNALRRKEAVDAELAGIENEFAAIAAYETSKRGRPGRKAVKRKRRTGRRAEILAMVKKNPSGISRADLLVAMGAKGDKSDEQSVSNALAALKKSKQIASKDGRYSAA